MKTRKPYNFLEGPDVHDFPLAGDELNVHLTFAKYDLSPLKSKSCASYTV